MLLLPLLLFLPLLSVRTTNTSNMMGLYYQDREAEPRFSTPGGGGGGGARGGYGGDMGPRGGAYGGGGSYGMGPGGAPGGGGANAGRQLYVANVCSLSVFSPTNLRM